MLTRVGAQAATGERSEEKRDQGNQGSEYRKFSDTGDGKTKEEDVPGHVAHEYVAQCEIADRVEHTGDRRQDEKQQRQRTVSVFRQEADDVQSACDDRSLFHAEPAQQILLDATRDGNGGP